MTAHRIVILGAGYAGLSAAKEAAKAQGAQVTVIDARTEFLSRVRLHQVIAGQPVERVDLRNALETKGIHFVNAYATRIDPAARHIELTAAGNGGAAPDFVEYDTLIYALGSRGDRTAVPGAAEFAHAVATPEDLPAMPALAGRVAVVGGGPTGIETAAELAESRPDLDVILVSSNEPGSWLTDKACNHIRATLNRLGVRVHADVKVAEVTAAGLELVGGGHIPADIVFWTAGFAVPEVAARSGLPVDAHGRLLVGPDLRVLDHEDIYAVGDAAAMPGPDGRELRMACATAMPAGGYLGKAVATRLRGKTPAPHKGWYILQCISLGRHDAVIQHVHADDSMARLVLTGRPAVFVKEQIVRGVSRVAKL